MKLTQSIIYWSSINLSIIYDCSIPLISPDWQNSDFLLGSKRLDELSIQPFTTSVSLLRWEFIPTEQTGKVAVDKCAKQNNGNALWLNNENNMSYRYQCRWFSGARSCQHWQTGSAVALADSSNAARVQNRKHLPWKPIVSRLSDSLSSSRPEHRTSRMQQNWTK